MLASILLAAMVGPPPLALDPGQFQYREGEAVSLSLLERGTDAPWDKSRVRWLFIRGGGHQANFDTIARVPKLSLLLEHPGSTLIGLDAPPQVDATGTVHVRSAAVVLLVSAGDGEVPPSATAVSKSGLDVEVRAMMDPTNAAVGSDLAFRLYRDGVAQAGFRLVAHHLQGGEIQTMTTGPEGFATMRVSRSGVWRVSTEFTRKLFLDPSGGAETASGSLTFEVPEVQR